MVQTGWPDLAGFGFLRVKMVVGSCPGSTASSVSGTSAPDMNDRSNMVRTGRPDLARFGFLMVEMGGGFWPGCTS